MKLGNALSSFKTRILFGNDARKKIYEGIELAGKSIGCTMGPRGSCVLIQGQDGQPIVTKDGVTVARALEPKDPLLLMGVNLVKEAANRTNDSAGDGTTTASVVTANYAKSCLKYTAADFSLPEMKNGILWASGEVIEHLKAHSRTVTDEETLKRVAAISANNDYEIGGIVSDAVIAAGPHGIVTVDDSKSVHTFLESSDGYRIDKGFISPYFINHVDKGIAMYNDCLVMLVDKKITTIQEIVPALESVKMSGLPCLLICQDIEGDALNTLVVNRTRGNFPIVVVKLSSIAGMREDAFGDLQSLVGGDVFSDSHTPLSAAKVDKFGRCSKVIVDSRSTTIIAQKTERLQERIEAIETLLEDPTLMGDELTIVKNRLSRLAAGIKIIRVGGSTEIEVLEKKHRIEDALQATMAAAQEGIVPGGGVALVVAAIHTEGLATALQNKSTDFLNGVKIVLAACKSPMEQIVDNTDQSFSFIYNTILTSAEGMHSKGYDALDGKFVDMFEKGIIDPVKVTRNAFQNATSVALAFLSLDAVIVED